VAEARLGRIGAALPRDLADGKAHAAGDVYDDLQIGSGQQVSAAKLIALKGYALDLCAAIVELYDQAGLVTRYVLARQNLTRVSGHGQQQEYQSREPNDS
jgi:hypothetical protein